MASRHEIVAPRAAFSKSTMTTVATASAAGALMGLGAPMALADGNSTAAAAPAAAVALATPAAATNTVATVDLGNVSAGEWEMETVVVEAEAAAPVAPAPAAEATVARTAATTEARATTQQAALPAEDEAAQPAYSGSASSVAATALAYQGAPYRWGGTTPAGWDCIGFVRYVYAQHGVSIGGYTSSVLSVGRQVPYSEARAGDILYWPGHVAISLGNGMNIGAWNESIGTTTGADSFIGVPTVIRVF